MEFYWAILNIIFLAKGIAIKTKVLGLVRSHREGKSLKIFNKIRLENYICRTLFSHFFVLFLKYWMRIMVKSHSFYLAPKWEGVYLLLLCEVRLSYWAWKKKRRSHKHEEKFLIENFFTMLEASASKTLRIIFKVFLIYWFKLSLVGLGIGVSKHRELDITQVLCTCSNLPISVIFIKYAFYYQ